MASLPHTHFTVSKISVYLQRTSPALPFFGPHYEPCQQALISFVFLPRWFHYAASEHVQVFKIQQKFVQYQNYLNYYQCTLFENSDIYNYIRMWRPVSSLNLNLHVLLVHSHTAKWAHCSFGHQFIFHSLVKVWSSFNESKKLHNGHKVMQLLDIECILSATCTSVQNKTFETACWQMSGLLEQLYTWL